MTEYIDTKDESKCYGCRACEQICPQHSIHMEANEEGFLYPQFDSEKCIHCGLCQKSCPHDNEDNEQHLPLAVFAAQYKKLDALMSSSSGGIFSALADYVVSNNGYVAGCIFNDEFLPIHVITKDKTVIEKMRGSKYAQSDTKNIYCQIKKILNKGELVLFTGTPCQVDGLIHYLQKDYSNLFLIDLICHGVPSPELLRNYLKFECNRRGQITDLKFRDKKKNGWCSQGTITYRKNSKTITKKISPYNNSYYNYYYLQNNVSRFCCYSCKYARLNRIGDLTIGDYWNMEHDFPDVDSKNGYSTILVNSEKGRKLLDHILDSLVVYEASLDSVVRNNANLSKYCDMPDSRVGIYGRITTMGYESVANEECRYQYLIPFVRKHMPLAAKRMLKRLLRLN